MFTVYLDDSGTAPNQKVAIGSAMIVPARRLSLMESEWNRMCAKYDFSSFHSSECVWKNPKSEFADWDDLKRSLVIGRVKQIAQKYGVQALSMSINKADYDDLVSGELREIGGKYHYTWAIRNVISALDNWADRRAIAVPFEYIFDWMDKSQKESKEEIETVMAQAESFRPGRYEGHYQFRKRCEVPGLQCTDFIAWTCYQYSLHAFTKSPLHPIANEAFCDLQKKRGVEWLVAVTQKREHLRDWAERESKDPRSQERRRRWMESRKLRP